mgnify:FL=1
MKLAFIGGGMMAEAVIAGVLRERVLPAADIFVSEHKMARVEELREKYSVQAFGSTEIFLQDMDVVFLAVKPQAAQAALQELAGQMRADALLVSIVAGLPLRKLEALLPAQAIIRVMSNTPLAVGAGMSAYALGTQASETHEEKVRAILAAAGRVVCLKEELLDAVTGLSGSGPAFAFLVIDALADGGVAAGLARKDALLLAAQTLLGAAKMVLDTGRHPDELRDQVTSPAGTTIAGLRVLEERAVRGAFLDAVLSAAEKSKSLGE